LVGCGAASAQGGGIHHIIMQQRGRVYEFDHGREDETVLPTVPESAADEQQERRAQALATCGNDVVRNLRHQGDARGETLRKLPVHFMHVFGN
jgi:alcohol dehydrogenase class IV